MFRQYDIRGCSAVGSDPTSSHRKRNDVDRRSTCFKSWAILAQKFVSALRNNCLDDSSCQRTLRYLGWVMGQLIGPERARLGKISLRGQFKMRNRRGNPHCGWLRGNRLLTQNVV